MTFEQIMEHEGFLPNPEQRKVIESTVNTVVSAGAGAGKTAVLSWRFLRLVMEEGVKPEEILTLTFTKKAANEMRERIYSRLMKARGSLPPDTLKSFSRATISTLDSFFAQIVRSDSISYGLPRDISVMSDDELEDLCDSLSMRFLSSPDNAQEVKAITSRLMPSAIKGGFFLPVARAVSLTGDYDAQRITEWFMDDVRRIYTQRREALQSMLDMLGNLNLSGKFAQQYDRIKLLFDTESLTEDDYFSLSGVKDPEIKELVGEIKPILGKGTGFSLLQDISKGDIGVSPLQKAVEKISLMLNSEKRRLGKLTFDDIVGIAVSALRDNLELRMVFKKRFRFIMIDEFQDNNSTQRDLLFLLAERTDIPGTAGVIPSVEDLDPCKLFFVGDEKQSIYRFRGADVSVFRHLQDEIGRNGNSLQLSTNYRSNSNLIDHFNFVFSNVLADSDHDYDARYVPILAGRKATASGSRIIFSVFDKSNVEDPDMDAGMVEAEAVGDYCRRILETDEFLVDGKRPEPKDIAILFRSAGNQMNIEKALKRRGIGYQIAETRSLMLDAVASDFYCLLNHLLYPEDVRSFMAVLKSPLCGMCDQSIRNVLEGGRPLEVDAGRYEFFKAFLSDLGSRAFRMTIPQLLETIYIRGGYKAYLSRNADSRSFIEHYEYLYSYAVAYEAEGRSLTDYVRFLRGKMGSSEKLPDVEVLHKDLSGVQIMSVHKSKGLEFKVVIYCGTGSRPRSDSSSYVFRYKGRLVASENKEILRILENEKDEMEQAELRRLMYVAFTRAKDHLIVMGGYGLNRDGSLSCADVLKWYSDVICFNPASMTCTSPEVVVEDISGTPLFKAVGNDETTLPVGRTFTEFVSRARRVSVTGSGLHQEKADSSVSGAFIAGLDVDPLIRELHANDRFGTLCHLVLENLVGCGSYEDVECHISDSEAQNRRLLEQARALADGFMESGLYRDYVKGHKTRQELRFYTPDAADADVAVEGVMDLVVFGDDFNLVIDYKTDMFKDPEIHRRQVQTYVRVAEEVFGKKCYGTLYYLRDGSSPGFWDRDGKVSTSVFS